MSKEIYDQGLDSSSLGLNESPKKLKHTSSKVRLAPLNSEPSELGEPITVSPQKRSHRQKVPAGYELADFEVATAYWNKRNYSKKVTDEYGETSY